MKLSKTSILSLLSVLALCISSLGLASPKASALSGSSFNRGNIISDALFYNGNTLSTSQIQEFLNSKVPDCDTNGQKLIYDKTYKDTVKRKKWSERRGVSTPFICLKNYSQTTPSISSNAQCSSYSDGSGAKSAATIINEVAKACKISEKVLLVLLEKEQSLVTDDWPWPVQFNKATGYLCTDSAPCDPDYKGFFNQVYSAAWQFKKYKNNPDDYAHIPNRENRILYNPNASCGRKTVSITNRATAGLYNYTPYTPNDAALNNLYGTGNSCSAYGNRNFWRLYNDWFGSTHPKCTSNDRTGRDVFRLFNVKSGKRFFTAMECEANVLDAYTSFRLEGVGFQQPPGSADGRTGVYRLVKGNKRFWTSSVDERNNLVNKHKFKLEGTAFIVLKSSSSEDKKPIYRLFNSKVGSHLWTPSENERDKVSSWDDWRYEGIAYYVIDD